jgi:hypothetical protein
MSVRFATSFNMDIILPTEAVLFMSGSALLFLASHEDKRISVAVQRFDLWFALAFLLAGIRAALWAIGFSVGTANLVILVFGIAAGSRLYFWFKQERQVKSTMADDMIKH